MATIRFYLHPESDAIVEWHAFYPKPIPNPPYPRPFYWSQMGLATGSYGYVNWKEVSYTGWDTPWTYPTNFFARTISGDYPEYVYRKSFWITQGQVLHNALISENCDRIAAGTWTFNLYHYCSVSNQAIRKIRLEIYLRNGEDETLLFTETTNDLKTYGELYPLVFTTSSQQAFAVAPNDRLVIKAFFEKIKWPPYDDGSNQIRMGHQGAVPTHSYVEFPSDETPLPAWLTEGNLFAPASTKTRLNTDHTMYSETGHEPKYVLDNDPNTYWKPDSTVDRTIYFDLGSNVQVDAFAFWIHNHNAGFGGSKAWKLSYSTDDSTYTTFDSKLFVDSRNAGVPFIAFKFENPVSARYWKFELIDFDETPMGPVAEIGGLWLMRDYSLPYDNQYPENIGLEWGNNKIVSRSGDGYQSRKHTGHTRSMGKQYVFVRTAHSALLRNAYRASYGSLLPIAFKPDYDSVDWLLCRFISQHKLNETWSEVYQPKIDVKEVGFKRIAYTTHTLPTLSTTVGHWKFTNSLADSSGNNHTLTAVDIPGGASYDYGICDHEKTCIMFDGDGLLNLDAADAALLDMGTSDFSLELILATDTVSETIYLLHKFGDSPSPPPSPEPSPSPLEAGYYIALTTTGKLNVCVGDGSNEVVGTDYGSNLDDGVFHYIAVTVDRTLDLLKVYIDGAQVGSNLDISSVTSDIGNSIESFQLGRENLSANPKQIIGVLDEVCVSKQLLTSALIQSRWAGCAHDGSWRL